MTVSKQLVPRAILSASRSQVIAEYKDFVEEVRYSSLSDSSLWKILKSIKPSQKQVMQGLDNVTADGLVALNVLETLVQDTIPINEKSKFQLK